jgi:hypothetical protein
VDATSTSRNPLPPTLMRCVAWAFDGSTFTDRVAFEAAVRGAQQPGAGWNPGEVVLRVPRVWVTPDVLWHPPDDPPVAEFAADDGQAFTAGELLFKVHNAFVADLREMDHKHFEGLALVGQEVGSPPIYEVIVGS